MDETRREAADQALEALDLGAFVGRDVGELRAAVAELGGTLRTLCPGQAVTLEYRPDRINAITDENDVVREAHRG